MGGIWIELFKKDKERVMFLFFGVDFFINICMFIFFLVGGVDVVYL